MSQHAPVRSFSWVILAVFIIIVRGFLYPWMLQAASREVTITGQTMGTVYQAKVVAVKHVDSDQLKKSIDQRLVQINQSMSTYQRHSEISRFNSLSQAPSVIS